MEINLRYWTVSINPSPTPALLPDTPDEPEWIEVGCVISFHLHSKAFLRTGLVIRTDAAAQMALTEYYNPGDDYWHVRWIGLEDIRRVVGRINNVAW